MEKISWRKLMMPQSLHIIFTVTTLFLLLLDDGVQAEHIGFPTGPAIGEQVAVFSLRDQNGEMQNLRSLIGPKGAILNFYRSASW